MITGWRFTVLCGQSRRPGGGAAHSDSGVRRGYRDFVLDETTPLFSEPYTMLDRRRRGLWAGGKVREGGRVAVSAPSIVDRGSPFATHTRSKGEESATQPIALSAAWGGPILLDAQSRDSALPAPHPPGSRLTR